MIGTRKPVRSPQDLVDELEAGGDERATAWHRFLDAWPLGSSRAPYPTIGDRVRVRSLTNPGTWIEGELLFLTQNANGWASYILRDGETAGLICVDECEETERVACVGLLGFNRWVYRALNAEDLLTRFFEDDPDTWWSLIKALATQAIEDQVIRLDSELPMAVA